MDYTDPEGNVLTLRQSLSPRTIQQDQQAAREGRGFGRGRLGAAERDALRVTRRCSWEISGLPLDDQKMLIGRYRMADSDEQRWVRETIAAHLERHIPELCMNIATPPEPMTLTYRDRDGRLRPDGERVGAAQVEGLEILPRSGPVLVVANHDSQTDPLAVGVAARHRRQIRALAKSSLWDKPGLGRVLDGMGQIPIERAAGDSDALVNAVAALAPGLLHRRVPGGNDLGRSSAPGTERRRSARSRGSGGSPRLRDGPRGPRRSRASLDARASAFASSSRPRVRPTPPRRAAGLAQRLLDELRALAPPVDAGRNPAKTLEKYERKLAEREEGATRRRAEAADRERV